MEYTVQQLGNLAGISTRTLRYYHEIGILKPARINSSGYRIYGEKEVDKLQQILFYRELGVGLEDIKKIVDSPDFNALAALKEHQYKLLDKRKQLDLLIENVNKTIALSEGRIKMSNKEKFQGFKDKLIKENEDKYGEEIREKYGEKTISQSNKRFKNLTEEQYNKMEAINEELFKILKEAYTTGNPEGTLAQKAADLHRQWLSFTWPSYSKEAHAGLAQMYVDDPRFTAYYDKEQPGLAKFLRDAVFVYTKK
ncbi:MerR family transcriptional regulator [Clostridium polynesiense]|uniref:MerR family transcriptional regulator n=1 Tax=Clostridium polynesiense TaxID=1325933 RepID=UPI00058C11A7|nr:MerR family transcriptional regulator [Clostridium polynesiense]